MAQIIAGLGAQLGLDTTEFKKGIGEAKDKLKELAEYLPEALSIAGFVELTKGAMEYANQIVETAKANDIATESVLRLSKALELNGGQAEDSGKLYSGFTQKLESAVQGNATAQASFEKLGVSLKDLATLSEQDLFEKTINGLANMKDAAERNGLAFQTLGKAIKGVDLVGLQDDLQRTKGQFDQYSAAIEDAHKMSEKLKASWNDMTVQFTTAVIPTLNKLYDSLKVGGDVIGDIIHWIGEFVKVASVMVKFTVTTVEVAISDLMTLGESAKLFVKGEFSDIGKLWDDQKKKTDAMVQSDFDFFDSLFGEKKADDAVKNIKKVEGAARQVVDAQFKQKAAADQISIAYKNQADAYMLSLKAQLAVNNETKNQKEINDNLVKILEQKNKAMEQVDKQLAAVDKQKAGHERITAELKKQKDEIDKTYSDLVIKSTDAIEANQKMRESFGFGWDQAFEQYKENAQTAADFGRQAFTTMTGAMTTALDNFVTTGKLNFKSLITSMIQDLIKFQLQMQATSLFSKAGNALGLGSIFSGGSAIKSSATYADQNLLASAVGGPLDAGQASIVGENGPEIFVPQGAGTVIPNTGDLSGVMGSGQQITYNGPYIASMQAIDTQSATQFLARNKTAVWAANQSAQRSLPQSR
jgi:lambda family phage tail tape measure protein